MKDGSTGNVHKISFYSIFMPVHDNNVVAVHPDLKAVRLTSDAVGFSDTAVHNESPFDQFKWNQQGELYQWFTDTYAGLSLHELRTKLDTNIQRIYGMIDAMTGEELFAPHRRKWAVGATNSVVR